MYQSIYVPVDNSDFSNRAVQTSLRLGKSYESKLTGCHVYAAKMHDYRFKQMEFTLPEEYLEEVELERQRKIHDSLITMGLELISDCYLNDMDQLCQVQGLEFERKMMDGKHSSEIVKDLGESDYDLVILGAQGIGRTRSSQLGSVCQRVTRESDRDVWVVKHLPKKGTDDRDTILVGVDGSPQSFGALMTGIDLAKRFGKKLELVSVYDPYLHYAVFKGIVEVLSEKAAKIFRFEEQNQLHEEVIDTGLAEIYQSHLNVAEKMARDEGVEVGKTLLDGKAFQKILDHAKKIDPWLLIIGRIGVHSDPLDRGLGSNTDNLLRLCECDILLTTAEVMPEIDLKAEESIHWTAEAESRMVRVPDMVKGIARTAILRLAIEKGHSVVTSDLVTEAMDRFMPKSAAAQTEKLAEALAFEKAREQSVSICRSCGVAARETDPVKCTVCGATNFEHVDSQIIDKIAASEGGVEEEVTYDGRKLKWTKESRKALRTLTDNYQRRRAKARIEKSARGKKLDTVTLEFAQRFIEEEGGVLYETQGQASVEQAAPAFETPTAEAPAVEAAEAEVEEDSDLKLLARDKNNNPLFSRFNWNDEAIERILRVPAGFMRERTQGRVEELAGQREVAMIDLALVEEGVQVGLQQMAEVIAQADGDPAVAAASLMASSAIPTPEAVDAKAEGGVCPVAAKMAEEQKVEEKPAEASSDAPAASKCPFAALANANDAEKPDYPLNEAGLMQELDRQRRDLIH